VHLSEKSPTLSTMKKWLGQPLSIFPPIPSSGKSPRARPPGAGTPQCCHSRASSPHARFASSPSPHCRLSLSSIVAQRAQPSLFSPPLPYRSLCPCYPAHGDRIVTGVPQNVFTTPTIPPFKTSSVSVCRGEIAFDPFGTPCPVRRAQRQGVEGQVLSASNTGSPSGAVNGPRGRADNIPTTFISSAAAAALSTQNGGTQLLRYVILDWSWLPVTQRLCSSHCCCSSGARHSLRMSTLVVLELLCHAALCL
jgi:hypothetical protein